jgi:fatty acid desaturase
MNKPMKVVYHSTTQEERSRQRHYQKDWPIIIVLAILFGLVSVLLGLWQAPVPTLISAL